MNPTIIIGIVVIMICISISIGTGVYLSQSSSASNVASSASSVASSASSVSVDTPAPYIPFSAGSQTATNGDDWGGGNTIYLDRHNVSCGNQPLNQLHLNRPAGDKIQWQYTCANGGKLGNPIAKTTPANDWGGGNTIYLDRHDADCGTGNVMTRLHLTRPAGDKIAWEYSCAPSTQSQPLTCRQVKTGANEDGGGNSIYFDRHDIKCNADEAISRLHLTRPSGNQIQWEYTCCK
jgi:hypothetical protein